MVATPERRGVVLDFDGVIVRSMELHAQAYRRTLAPHGIPVKDADVFEREGARSETIIRDLAKIAGRDLDEAAVKRAADEKQKLYMELGPPELYPGAADLVRGLRTATMRLGLVTGTRKENLPRLIPDLLPLFDAVLAQDSYKKDKPHPEPYRRTAEALGVVPPSLAAIENAPRGVQSAKAAGYAFVVAIPTTVTRAELEKAGADAVATDQADALRRIQSWLGGDGSGPQ